MDGTPDFVVMCRSYAAGKGIIKDFMVYYLDDSTFEMYDDASRSYNDLYCNFSFEIGSPNVDDPYMYLYRGNSTGTYRYYTDSGSTSGEGVGYINLSGDYDIMALWALNLMKKEFTSCRIVLAHQVHITTSMKQWMP
ncbi:MAG: hypothetical protein LIO74_04845 [Ruminococcus sp.]|nr:hypothetical protein [Ruminococcus sp.]